MSGLFKIGNDVTMEYIISDMLIKFEGVTYRTFFSIVTANKNFGDSPFYQQNFARRSKNEKFGIHSKIICVETSVCKKNILCKKIVKIYICMYVHIYSFVRSKHKYTKKDIN